MTDEEVLKFVRRYEEPCVTTGDVAQEFDVTREGANYRLKKLAEQGKLKPKEVGSSAIVYYPIG